MKREDGLEGMGEGGDGVGGCEGRYLSAEVGWSGGWQGGARGVGMEQEAVNERL